MSRLEYLLASGILRLVHVVVSRLPIRADRVVLATARVAVLDGNLLRIHRAIRAMRPGLDVVTLLEPYSYGLRGKVAYLARLIRGMYLVQTARLVVLDNAYLPVHVAPHRPGTTVVQVWHAVGALKRFGLDTARPIAEPERSFLHRGYDYVVVAGEASRAPYAAALRTPVERVLVMGSPRTDFFFDSAAVATARDRVVAERPALAGRRVVLFAPTFRGRGAAKRAARHLDAARLRAALPDDHVLVLKTHPNLDPAATPTAGFDVVVDPAAEINDLLAATDVLVTDYSSSVIEFALLRRPIVLLVPDLAEYEADPGLYLDYRREIVGVQVADTDGVIAAVETATVDGPAYDAFIERHLGASRGGASARFVERFVPD